MKRTSSSGGYEPQRRLEKMPSQYATGSVDSAMLVCTSTPCSDRIVELKPLARGCRAHGRHLALQPVVGFMIPDHAADPRRQHPLRGIRSFEIEYAIARTTSAAEQKGFAPAFLQRLYDLPLEHRIGAERQSRALGPPEERVPESATMKHQLAGDDFRPG